MTYILIWIIIAGTGNNVAATGSAEFTGKAACVRAAETIIIETNSKRFVQAIASCHHKGF